jgi:hypothetical protein
MSQRDGGDGKIVSANDISLPLKVVPNFGIMMHT